MPGHLRRGALGRKALSAARRLPVPARRGSRRRARRGAAVGGRTRPRSLRCGSAGAATASRRSPADCLAPGPALWRTLQCTVKIASAGFLSALMVFSTDVPCRAPMCAAKSPGTASRCANPFRLDGNAWDFHLPHRPSSLWRFTRPPSLNVERLILPAFKTDPQNSWIMLPRYLAL